MVPGNSAAAMSYAEVKDQTGNLRRPIMARWGWGGSLTNGHMLVLTGYDTVDSQVFYIDPADGKHLKTTYSAFLADSKHNWTNSLWGMH